MKQQHILRMWSVALAATIVVANFASFGPRLAAQTAAGVAVPSSEGGEPSLCTPAAQPREPLAPANSNESRLAQLWADVALKPESAVALARLANTYADAGDTVLALQSFQLALDQLSTDPDLDGPARVQFRYAVEKRIRLLRNPGLSLARSGQIEGQAKKQSSGN